MGGKNGGIFEEWLRNISTLIFTQTFHAIFMAFILEIISFVTIEQTEYSSTSEAWGANDGVLAIISMVAIMSLIKMEKMIKEMLGVKTSKHMGGIGENFAKSMAGIKSAGSMAARTAKPAMKTGQLIKDKKLNGKAMLEIASELDGGNGKKGKRQELKELEEAGPGSREAGESKKDYKQRKAEYNEKVKKARDEVNNLEKELNERKSKDNKLKADIKAGRIETATTFGSTVAASAFGVGASSNLADAAILANPTDKLLDYIAGRGIKDHVYGKASNAQQAYIEQLPEEMARRQVRNEYPEIDENSVEFETKVRAKFDDDNFKKQVETAIKSAMNTKFEIDMEIPTGKLKQGLKAIADTYKEAGRSFSAESRAGRANARNIRKNGVEYRGHSVDNVDDI